MRKSTRDRKPLVKFDPSLGTKEHEEEVDENSEIPLDFNPWNVTNFDAFLVYECPECKHKSHDCVTFAKHAAIKHHKVCDIIVTRCHDMFNFDLSYRLTIFYKEWFKMELSHLIYLL